MGKTESKFKILPVDERQLAMTFADNQRCGLPAVSLKQRTEYHSQEVVLDPCKNGYTKILYVTTTRPYPRVVASSCGDVELAGVFESEDTNEWQMLNFGEMQPSGQSGSCFDPIGKKVSLKWPEMRDKSLLVAFRNVGHMKWLSSRGLREDDSPRKVHLLSDEQIKTLSKKNQSASCCLWVVECVGHELSDSELTMAIGGPFLAAFAIPTVVVASPFVIPVVGASVAVGGAAAAGASAVGVIAGATGFVSLVGGGIAQGLSKADAGSVLTAPQIIAQAAQQYMVQSTSQQSAPPPYDASYKQP
jgi:hypothetical protein